jgi:glycosyltransferase involved in cell wall biosynthesis
MQAFYENADALLLSLKKDEIFSLTIPSKLQSYFAFGKPVVASIDGEGARIVIEAGAGFVSAAEDSKALANQIEKAIHSSKEELNQMASNAKKYFEKEFEREALLDRLENILKTTNES